MGDKSALKKEKEETSIKNELKQKALDIKKPSAREYEPPSVPSPIEAKKPDKRKGKWSDREELTSG